MIRVARGLGLATLLVVLALLVRNGLAIPAHVPLDPNEGWMAAHVLRLMAGGPLYPPPTSLMVNNYPPLSFYLIAVVTRLTGDAVVAGRVLAFASFLIVCGGIIAVARCMGTSRMGAALGALFFAALLLIASDYVGIADPQMLGHAVQMAALLLMLRGRIVTAALLFAASLFLKHSLLALPLTSAMWLMARDTRAGLRFIAAGFLFAGGGLVAFQMTYGISLWSQLASPRLSSLANIETALTHLWWAIIPLLALPLLRGPHRGFLLTYTALALVLGLVFSMGDGVDANAFFDLGLALSLTLAMAPQWLGALAPLPLLVFLPLHWDDNASPYSRDFAAQSAGDIAFLRAHPGPALCSQLSLCQWAGKPAQADVFNIGEAFQTGARDPASLTHQIAAHRFAVIQLDDTDALGPVVKGAIARAYRPHHDDDNGTFFLPR